MKNFLDDLKSRGIINNITNEDKVIKAFENQKGIYVGFDPSAESLHLGNYTMIMFLKRLSRNNIKTYALVGGATGMIGDPSGKSDERNLLDANKVENNKKFIKEQLEKFSESEILDNYDHFKDINFLTFLRTAGKLINVNYMLEKESISTRLETGISFTEFAYTLIQGYDFLHLYENKNIYLQAGGSDQWGNITTGIEMIRKNQNTETFAAGLTLNLLLKSDGKKFGKSEKEAIFLEEKLTSPYEMYQFLINQNDSDVIKLLNFLTLIPTNDIKEIAEKSLANPREKIAQNILAEDIVINVHGKEKYEQSLKISKTLFSGNILDLTTDEIKMIFNTIPSMQLVNNDYNLKDILTLAEFSTSNKTARELINNNSIEINGKKINDENTIINNQSIIVKDYTIIKKGKKNYKLIKWINE